MSEQQQKIDFYLAPQTRSITVHWMLEEVGAPYRMRVLDLARREHKDAPYLAINPMGKVPALVHEGTVITEVAAICFYLADAFPEAGLAPPVGDPQRGSYLRWLLFMPGCAEPALMDRMLERPPGPSQALAYGDLDTMTDVMAKALTPGPYLLGDRFSAADVIMGAGIRFSMLMKLLPERPEFLAYVDRLGERPALQRALAQEAELPPRTPR